MAAQIPPPLAVSSSAAAASACPFPLARRSPPGIRRAWWLRVLLQVHWISSAICLLGVLLFSVSGFTLNHSTQIEAKPEITRRTLTLPAALLAALDQPAMAKAGGNRPLPPALADWLEQRLPIDIRRLDAEWSADEVYLALPRPGGDAWLRIDRADGGVEYELTERGWISWLNDLHKGRHTGLAWRLWIDALAVGCLLFSLTGLLILQVHAGQRLATWPLVGLGVVVPALIALLFIH